MRELLSKYDELFQERLGTFKDYEAKIEVDPGATSRFCKARTVPYAMREKVEEELNRLVVEQTLEPVDYSDWAAPIVAVMKSDRKSVRVCGSKSRIQAEPLPDTQDGGPLRNAKTRKDLHEARPEPGVPAAQAGGGVEQVRGY